MTNEDLTYKQAADWCIALCGDEMSRRDRGRFVDWLRASPENLRAYLDVAHTWQMLGESDMEPSLKDLAVDARTETNVVPIMPAANSANPRIISRKWRHYWTAAAAGLVLMVGAMIFLLNDSHVVRTAVGEQRSIALEDGSVLMLNTQTAIRYQISDDERFVELVEGEALFKVARDENRPFIVKAGSALVRVLGTQFNVFRNTEKESTVTVLEGRVAVTMEPTLQRDAVDLPSPAEHEFTIGQQVHVNRDEGIQTREIEVEKAVAWTLRKLHFENTALPEVVAEFNRYNARKMRVVDPQARVDIRLNGVFEPQSEEALLEYLERVEGVTAERVSEQLVLLH